MIARIWRARVRPERLGDYRRFIEERALPMFTVQRGCLGALFAESSDGHAVITLWADQESLNRLERSHIYQRTANALDASAILKSIPSVEILTTYVGFTERS